MNESLMVLVLVGGLGCLLGTLVVWLWGRSRMQLERANCEQLQQQLSDQSVRMQGLEQADSQRIRLQDQLEFVQQQQEKNTGLLAATEERLRERDEAIAELREQLGAAQQTNRQFQQIQQENSQLRAQLERIGAELAKSEEARQQESRHAGEQLKLLEQNRQQLKQEFEQLAHKIFEEKQQQFTSRNQQGLESLLKPFSEQIKSFRDKVEQVYVEEGKERATLKAEIKSLHTLNQQITEEAANLTRALKGDKKLQGNWGEIQVEMILEQSGLRRDIEYKREENFKDEGNENKRVDFIVYLPDNKHLIIDSKVSLVAYSDYVAADDEPQQQQSLNAHLSAVRNHIQTLSSKDYAHLKGVDSPDFVIMFMPIEPAFNLAFLADQQLFNRAFEQNIVVTTPTTLLATLRTVANLWSIERRNQSAQQIAGQAGRVYDKLRGVVEKMEKLGRQLESAQKSYGDAWNSLKEGRGNLVSQAERFRELGVRVKKELPRELVEAADPLAHLEDSEETNDSSAE